MVNVANKSGKKCENALVKSWNDEIIPKIKKSGKKNKKKKFEKQFWYGLQ